MKNYREGFWANEKCGCGKETTGNFIILSNVKYFLIVIKGMIY